MGSIWRFGSALEWGLTRDKHREICAELSDHLACAEEQQALASGDSGGAGETDAAKRLAQPASRHRLAAAHLSDQVVATLHRRPSRQEWRELMWLGIWFALIVASD